MILEDTLYRFYIDISIYQTQQFVNSMKPDIGGRVVIAGFHILEAGTWRYIMIGMGHEIFFWKNDVIFNTGCFNIHGFAMFMGK